MTIRAAKQRNRRRTQPRSEVDVLVLGAGAAGLMAARRLAEQGLRVVVLEARKRVGGRIDTRHAAGVALPLELGAEFVHGDAPRTEALAREAGLPLIDIDATHWGRGRGGVRPIPRYEESLAVALERSRRVARTGADRSFAESLAGVRGLPRVRAIDFVEGFQAARVEEISAKALAKDDLGQQKLRRVLGGLGALPEHLLAKLPPGAVHFETVVERVSWRRAAVEIRSRRAGGAQHTYRAPRAVIALPCTALQDSDSDVGRVRFAPALASKTRALEHIRMGSVVKLVMRFREPFWEDERMVLLHAHAAAFPTWWTNHPIHAPLLVAWAGGSKAIALAAAREAEIVATALTSLAHALGVRRARIEALCAGAWRHDWMADPFARGAYSHALVGGSRAASVLATPVEGTLFFAGEATCSAPANGTVEGALASGERVAREVLASLADGV
jgi:monoamine oxidase